MRGKEHKDEADVLVLGGGLAGAALVWRLIGRGLRPVVVDRGGVDAAGRPSASSVAAGLITPITGKRLVLSAGWDSAWPIARQFYRRLEQTIGAALLTERPAVRLFSSKAEVAVLERRCEVPDFARRVRRIGAGATPESFDAPWGGIELIEAARLDVPGFLDATRDTLAEQGAYCEASLDPKRDLRVDGVGIEATRLGVRAKLLVSCVGWPGSSIEGMPDRFRPAKGEVLRVAGDGLPTDRVMHRGVWLSPCDDGTLLLGATHDWSRLDSTPTDTGREELLSRLREFHTGEVRVVDHLAAVRPTTVDHHPLVGFSDELPRVGWLNGLGTKGALWAPVLADRLAAECLERLKG